MTTPMNLRFHPSAPRRARACVAVLLLFLWAPSARAGDVTVEVEEYGGAYHIRGVFIVPASRRVVWDVLTDYEHIGRFVPSVRENAVERGSEGHIVLRQAASVGIFPFTRTAHITLVVAEEPERRIGFRDIAGKDFRSYAGEWVLAADSSVTSVAYGLDAVPRAAIPHMLGRGMLSSAARDLLSRVRAEMIRRAAIDADRIAKGATP